MIEEMLEDMAGTSMTPSATQLFNVNTTNPVCLNKCDSEIFVHMMMQLLGSTRCPQSRIISLFKTATSEQRLQESFTSYEISSRHRRFATHFLKRRFRYVGMVG
jgi:hypothetical protein